MHRHRPPPARSLPPLAAAAIVFGASGAVLVIEILAIRLIAPYVGVSLETYTAVIGIVLAGISMGTWLGGRIADFVPPQAMLGPLLMLGGLLALLSLPAVRLLGEATTGTGPAAIVLLAVFCFFPPAAVLSAVTPTVVKLQLASLDRTGSVVGRLSALGTLGALTGTFVTGFVLVAAVPTGPIVISLGIALAFTGVAVVAWLRLAGRSAVGAVLLAVVASASAGAALRPPCEVESAYFCARVVIDPARAFGRELRLDTLRHSYVDLADPDHLEFEYTELLGDVVEVFRPRSRAIRALHVGGGGFTMPRYVLSRRPGSRNTVLELDPALVRLARRRLGLRTGPGLRVRTGDARITLRDEPPGAYDLAIGDAFGSLSVPWHLTTREFVADLRRRLRPGGVYAVNVIDRPTRAFVRAEAATLAAAFGHVAVVAPPATLAGREDGPENFVLVASDAPLPLAGLRRRIAARGDDDEVLAGTAVDRFAAGAPVLTDDFAPVDQMLAGAS